MISYVLFLSLFLIVGTFLLFFGAYLFWGGKIKEYYFPFYAKVLFLVGGSIFLFISILAYSFLFYRNPDDKILILSMILSYLLISIPFLASGVCFFIKKRIKDFSPPLYGKICLIVIGGLFLIFSLILFFYLWQKNSSVCENPLHEIRQRLTQEENKDFFMLISMISSSYYEDNVYKGSNYRGMGGYYRNFFNVEEEDLVKNELIRLPPNANDETNIQIDDGRLVFIWKLYKRYMETRFNLNRTLNTFQQTMKKIECISENITPFSDNYPTYRTMIANHFVISYSAYKSIFKLLYRNLIQKDTGIKILNFMKNILIETNKKYSFILGDDIIESNNALIYSLEKELNRGSYHPVEVLHQNGILFSPIRKQDLLKYVPSINRKNRLVFK